MVGPSTLATRPVPRPDSRPKNSVTCHRSVAKLDAARDRVVRTRLASVTARIP
jgi:hypothetical protein